MQSTLEVFFWLIQYTPNLLTEHIVSKINLDFVLDNVDSLVEFQASNFLPKNHGDVFSDDYLFIIFNINTKNVLESKQIWKENFD